VDGDGRLQPDPANETARRLPRIDFDFAACDRAVTVLSAHGCLMHGHRPYTAATPEQGAQAVDRVQKVAAVALHHAAQQVAAGMAAETSVRGRRQPGQQYPSRLA